MCIYHPFNLALESVTLSVQLFGVSSTTDRVSTKTKHRELHKTNIHERAETAKTFLTDTSAKT